MKAKFFLIALLFAATACETYPDKQSQKITFGEIPPQNLRDGQLELTAVASSGLPVAYEISDSEVAEISGSTVRFKQAGVASITAVQAGNSQYYEAPNITQQLIVRDWDPNKKTQTITFAPPAEWRLSRDYQILNLSAESSAGLPVNFTLVGDVGYLLSAGKIYFYHAGETAELRQKYGADYYEATLTVIASQSGNDEYNPADNVAKTIYVTGDVTH